MPSKTRVFRFIKDVQHEPAAQLDGHRRGEVLIATYAHGVSVSDRAEQVSVIVGHGVTDEFKIGAEVEELDEQEAQHYVRADALCDLTDEQRVAFTG